MRVATRVTGGISGVGDVSLMRVDVGNEDREKVDDRRRRRPTLRAWSVLCRLDASWHPCAHAHAYEHSCPCPRMRAGALERRRPRRAGPTAVGRRAGRGRAARRRMRACMDSARAVLSGVIGATAVAARQRPRARSSTSSAAGGTQ